MALFFVIATSSLGQITNPILFVTQPPIPGDFTAVASVFGNHDPNMESTGRGGDLYIRYPDGTLKNLTRTAGYGSSENFQGTNAIAVRDPYVYWDGTKALFSMVIGAPSTQYVYETYFWQMYEITGLGSNQTPVITKVSNQDTNFNNITPIYGTDDRIIFTTDRPRSGESHLYPQLDEYEEAPTVTGLWSLDPDTGDLFMLNHLPSGAFTPTLDSFGRVVFSRWDHLQRDQQADADNELNTYGTFNYSDETETATIYTNDRSEIFPEPRYATNNVEAHSFNLFFPWQINEDGTSEEILGHLGRHELSSYFNLTFNDPSLDAFNPGSRVNTNSVNNVLQIKEDPVVPGRYICVDAPEFYTHAAGQIIAIYTPPGTNADYVQVEYITHRETASFDSAPSTNHSGLYRDPVCLSDGTLISAHTAETDFDSNQGDRAFPQSRYDFRLKTLTQTNGVWVADQALTPGLYATNIYWDPDVLVTHTGQLWELQPVEVKSRTRPDRLYSELEEPEQQILAEENIDEDLLRDYLRERNLALLVSRNVTHRDQADRQQPFNLKVANSTNQTLGDAGTIYEIGFFQMFQGDQIRGKGLYGGSTTPDEGRRVLAQYLHDDNGHNPTAGPPSSVEIASDGSVAAFVPARRAMTWQLTDTNGTPVVRERYWITFQPGEIRTCTSCHGINVTGQAGQPAATNSPEALRQLLQFWKPFAVTSSPVRIDSVTVASSSPRLQLTGITGQTFAVQTSTNLSNWTDLATNVINGSVTNYTDSVSNVLRFYRTRLLP